MPWGTPTSLGTVTSNTAAHSATISSVTVAQNLLIVVSGEMQASANGDAILVSDSAGNSYTVHYYYRSANQGGCFIAFAIAATALSSGSITIADTSTTGTKFNAIAAAAYSVSGAATSGTEDTAAFATNSGGATTSPTITSGTPANSGDLFWAVYGTPNNNGTYSEDTGDGWTNLQSRLQPSSGASTGIAYQVNSGTGTKAHDPTTSSLGYEQMIVAFVAAASAVALSALSATQTKLRVLSTGAMPLAALSASQTRAGGAIGATAALLAHGISQARASASLGVKTALAALAAAMTKAQGAPGAHAALGAAAAVKMRAAGLLSAAVTLAAAAAVQVRVQALSRGALPLAALAAVRTRASGLLSTGSQLALTALAAVQTRLRVLSGAALPLTARSAVQAKSAAQGRFAVALAALSASMTKLRSGPSWNALLRGAAAVAVRLTAAWALRLIPTERYGASFPALIYGALYPKTVYGASFPSLVYGVTAPPGGNPFMQALCDLPNIVAGVQDQTCWVDFGKFLNPGGSGSVALAGTPTITVSTVKPGADPAPQSHLTAGPTIGTVSTALGGSGLTNCAILFQLSDLLAVKYLLVYACGRSDGSDIVAAFNHVTGQAPV